MPPPNPSLDDGSVERYVRLNRELWRRFSRTVAGFLASEVGGKALWMFVILICLLLAINALNVVNSYVGRDFMTAIERRNVAAFVRQAVRYVGVFALSTLVAVLYRFTEERLGLLWRESMTRRLLQGYLASRVYYRLNALQRIANPDQRIADDVRAFATSTLSFVLLLLNGSITVLAFSGVLWSISPLLFVVGLGYASAASLVTFAMGRPLMRLNYAQSDREADFRADLIHLRENAESIALLHRERRIEARLRRHLDALTANLRRIIAVNRNLGFFTTGYNYMIQVIPALIVAPMFMRGTVEFGVITQSAMAFSHLLGAFSLIVTQFQSISSYAAVVARLSALGDAIRETSKADRPTIEIVEAENRVSYEQLTLRSPRDDRVLVEALSVSIPSGTRLLIRGSNDTAKVALVRATAGMWDRGTGRVVRPGPEDLLFLPERPYLPPGTLREVLVRAGREHAVSGDQIIYVLHTLGLEKIVARAGGLDVGRDWNDILSLDEQQLLAVARLLLAVPRWVFLDRIRTALTPAQVELVLRTFSQLGITYIAVSNGEDQLTDYDAVLELGDHGEWRWRWIEDGRLAEHPPAGDHAGP